MISRGLSVAIFYRQCVSGFFTLLVMLMLPILEAHSGWREDVGTFKIGIVSSKNKINGCKVCRAFSSGIARSA